MVIEENKSQATTHRGYFSLPETLFFTGYFSNSGASEISPANETALPTPTLSDRDAFTP